MDNQLNFNNIILSDVNAGEVEIIRKWRNNARESLRTPGFLNYEMQQEFYNNIICNKNSKYKYYGIFVIDEEKQKHIEEVALKSLKSPGINFDYCKILVGMGGITNIEWENRIAEISLIIGPQYTKKGIGKKAVSLLLDEGFNNLGLYNIYGEVYQCNKNIKFWYKEIEKYKAYKTTLPCKKYFNGIHYNSIYFNFNKFECTK